MKRLIHDVSQYFILKIKKDIIYTPRHILWIL